MSHQIEIAKKYVKLAETMSFGGPDTSQVIHADYLQWELPNALNKGGQKSDLKDSIRRMESAKKMIASQTYEISSVIEQGATVVMEALWTGRMAIDAGPLKKDQEMKAHFCMIFEFKDGKIHRVRNYDCFEPLA